MYFRSLGKQEGDSKERYYRRERDSMGEVRSRLRGSEVAVSESRRTSWKGAYTKQHLVAFFIPGGRGMRMDRKTNIPSSLRACRNRVAKHGNPAGRSIQGPFSCQAERVTISFFLVFYGLLSTYLSLHLSSC